VVEGPYSLKREEESLSYTILPRRIRSESSAISRLAGKQEFVWVEEEMEKTELNKLCKDQNNNTKVCDMRERIYCVIRSSFCFSLKGIVGFFPSPTSF